jgi:hypothetical protein
MQHFWIPLGISPVLYWFSTVDAHIISYHFLQFPYSGGGLRARRSFMQHIWLACVWVVWNERNLRLFLNLSKFSASAIGKSQNVSISVAEAAKCFSNYELSLLVVKPIVLFGY